ncbi:MAG: hypothetical protein IT292_04735 [Deltaproteobacteria bacterium]|nr:hypothetical protein [Deltaproteobacteria bacterium]
MFNKQKQLVENKIAFIIILLGNKISNSHENTSDSSIKLLEYFLMAESLKINIPDEICLITIRTRSSELWFINNRKFERELLGYLAKYQQEYGVILYAFILMGNHYHLIVSFPLGNRDKFEKAFNRIFANVLKRHVKGYSSGPVWARRYRSQALLTPSDVLNYFFYVALNPISSGIVSSIDNYSCFNSYYMSLTGETMTFELVDWRDYNNRKRCNKTLKPKDCIKKYTLKFSRLPEHENDTQEIYQKFLEDERITRSKILIRNRIKSGKGFLGTKKYRKQIPGSLPRHTKISKRDSHYPLALSADKVALAKYYAAYYEIRHRYKVASKLFRQGNLSVIFPPGTYRPSASVGITTKLA